LITTIDKKTLVTAILASYRFQTEASANNYADEILATMDPDFCEALQCWLDGKPVPNITVGKYSLGKILSIRHSTDYLHAFLLLTEYKKDAARGEKMIWKPIRGLIHSPGGMPR